jgi:hypothetical protein
MAIVTERDKETAKAVANMLIAMRIPPLTRNMGHYERAKERWETLCLDPAEYEPGIQQIADWIGV